MFAGKSDMILKILGQPLLVHAGHLLRSGVLLAHERFPLSHLINPELDHRVHYINVGGSTEH